MCPALFKHHRTLWSEKVNICLTAPSFVTILNTVHKMSYHCGTDTRYREMFTYSGPKSTGSGFIRTYKYVTYTVQLQINEVKFTF